MITFHSSPMSVYLWTATHVAVEKGVAYAINPVDPSSPEHRRLHPFGKMPVLQHGEVFIYETAAIAHYIDRSFDGPPLQPADALGQARMLSWISVVNSYLFPVMNGLIKERFIAPTQGREPNEQWIASVQPSLVQQVELIDRTVRNQDFLAGDQLTIADSFLLPHLHFASLAPEGAAALTEAPAARDWLARLRERPSFATSNPIE